MRAVLALLLLSQSWEFHSAHCNDLTEYVNYSAYVAQFDDAGVRWFSGSKNVPGVCRKLAPPPAPPLELKALDEPPAGDCEPADEVVYSRDLRLEFPKRDAGPNGECLGQAELLPKAASKRTVHGLRCGTMFGTRDGGVETVSREGPCGVGHALRSMR